MSAKKDFENELLSRLASIEDKVDALRTQVIPEMDTKIAVLKEKARNTAAIISATGVIITAIVSAAIAWYK